MKRKPTKQNLTFLERINALCIKYNTSLVWFCILLFLVLSFRTFDIKVNTGGDDAGYITGGIKMIRDFPNYLFTFHGTLYSIFLGLVYLVFGNSLFIMKLTSVLFVAASIFYLNKLLKTIGTAPILAISTVLFFAVNFYVIYYSHYTFTESLFFLLQFAFLYYYIKNLPQENSKKFAFQRSVFICGLLLGIIVNVRGVGYGIVPVLVVFHIIYKRWPHFLNALAGFFSFSVFYWLLKKIIWGEYLSTTNANSQAKSLFLKDPYYPDKGTETFIGFIERFFDNVQIYISKRLFDIFGVLPNEKQTYLLLSILVTAFVVAALILFIKQKRYKMLLIWGHCIGLTCLTFLMVQARWDQLRLILVFAPFFFLFIYQVLYYLVKEQAYIAQLLFFGLLLALPILNLRRNIKTIEETKPTVFANVQGNMIAGYTPDWQNYILACKWAANNLPENAKVACRKPAIAYILTGGKMNFFGVYTMPTKNPDSLVQNLRKNNVDYIVMARLRKYKQQRTKYTINTISRYLFYIQKKYPYIITPLHKSGNLEPATVFRINYPIEEN